MLRLRLYAINVVRISQKVTHSRQRVCTYSYSQKSLWIGISVKLHSTWVCVYCFGRQITHESCVMRCHQYVRIILYHIRRFQSRYFAYKWIAYRLVHCRVFQPVVKRSDPPLRACLYQVVINHTKIIKSTVNGLGCGFEDLQDFHWAAASWH